MRKMEGHYSFHARNVPIPLSGQGEKKDSTMIKVINEVNIYEINGEDTKSPDLPKLHVESHWNYSDRVTLLVGGIRYTVSARDLKAAIDNAIHVG